MQFRSIRGIRASVSVHDDGEELIPKSWFARTAICDAYYMVYNSNLYV